MTDEYVDKMLTALDKDSNQTLDQDEFYDFIVAIFNRMIAASEAFVYNAEAKEKAETAKHIEEGADASEYEFVTVKEDLEKDEAEEFILELKEMLADEDLVTGMATELFYEADDNEDQVLDVSELKSVFEKLGREQTMEVNVTQQYLDNVMASADVNNDQLLTQEEFVPVARKILKRVLFVLNQKVESM